jgi:hypothetical protein
VAYIASTSFDAQSPRRQRDASCTAAGSTRRLRREQWQAAKRQACKCTARRLLLPRLHGPSHLCLTAPPARGPSPPRSPPPQMDPKFLRNQRHAKKHQAVKKSE